jgi:hypothetical protein
MHLDTTETLGFWKSVRASRVHGFFPPNHVEVEKECWLAGPGACAGTN